MECPHCNKDNPRAIPKERLDEESDKRQVAERKLKAAEAEAGVATRLAEQVKSLEGQLAGKDAQHARDVAFLDADIKDPSIREVFGTHFDRQASAEGGEKDPAKWLAGLKAAPEKMPGVLSALMPRAQAQAAAQSAAAKAPAAAKPANEAPAKTVTGAPSLTAEQVAKMSPREMEANWEAIRAAFPDLKLPPNARPGTPAAPAQPAAAKPAA